MAIFSRRTIQRIIFENSAVLTPDCLRKKMNELNSPKGDTISLEWELSVINAFGKLGKLEHERTIERSKPDIYLQPHSCAQSLIADITCVSDRGLAKANPFESLVEDIKQEFAGLRKQGNQGHLSIRVGGVSDRTYKGSAPTKLRLPKRGRFNELIFNHDFRKFLRNIKQEPARMHAYAIKTQEIDLSIQFGPGPNGTSGSHPSYTAAHSLKRNPVLNALQAKADQLKRSGFRGARGIVLCDGGCQIFTAMESWSTYSLKEIIAELFRLYSSVDFILVLWIEERFNPSSTTKTTIKLRSQLYTSPRSKALDTTLATNLANFWNLLPEPRRTPANAYHHLQWLRRTQRGHEDDSFRGGMTVTDKTIKVSSREVLRLLSGQLDAAAFSRQHSISGRNPFDQMLSKGRTIAKVSLKPSEIEEDDDWLEFEFSERPDPAISRYRSD